MLKNSTKFFDAFNQDVRQDLSVRVTINDTVYGNDDIFSVSYDSGSMPGDQLEIGSSYSNSVKIKFSNIVTTFKELDKVVVEIGIKRTNFNDDIIGGKVAEVGYAPIGLARLNGYLSEMKKTKSDVRGGIRKGGLMYLNRWNVQEEYEYSRMGEFYISEQIDVNWNDKTTSLECSDALVFTESTYSTALGYPARLKDIAREVCENVGLTLDYINQDDLPDMYLTKFAEGITNREALEKISHFIVGYAKISRYGYLELKSFVETGYSIDPTYYFAKGLTKNDIRYVVGGITCTVSDDSETTTLHSGSYIGSQITIENSAMTQEKLDVIYNKLTKISYYPYSLSWRGNPALEVGDLITVSDLEGNIYKVPNISYTLEFNGALKGSSSADTTSTTKVVSSNNSPLLNKITKSVNEVKAENTVISNKVTEVDRIVGVINEKVENVDLEGIKSSVENIVSLTRSFQFDIDEINEKINGLELTEITKKINELETAITDHTGKLREITTGTGWLPLTSLYTNGLYASRYRNRNKRVELQFSLKGFTAEGQTAITLPEGSRSQRLIYKSLTTLEGKSALVSIGIDGTVKIAKVFGSVIAITDVFTLDTSFPID